MKFGLASLLLAIAAMPAIAAEGDLDLSFGYYMDGTAYLPIEDRMPGQVADDRSVAILPQSDGSTIMVGNINRTSRHGPPTAYENIGIAKLRPEGTYEYAFGTIGNGGWLILPGSGVAGNEIHAWSAVQDIAGRIAVAGYRTVGGTRSMAVWMVTPYGALDTTFGVGGVLMIDRGVAGSLDEARSIIAPTLKDTVAMNASNGFSVVGSLRDSSGALSVGALFSITANGGLYTSVRGTHAIPGGPNAGVRYTRMPVPAAFATCNTSAVNQAFRSVNSEIFTWYVIGNISCSDGSRRVMTTRLGTNDQPVAGYGSSGTTTFAFDTAVPSRSQASAVDIDAFGRAAIAGSTLQADLVTPANMAAALINFAGVPDGNFNGTGTRVLSWPSGSSSSGTDVLVQRNNRLLVSGNVVISGEPVMALTRLLPNASVDPAWTNGIGRTYPFLIQNNPSPARTTASSFAIGESVMLGGWVRDQRPAFADVYYGAMRMQGDLIYANGWGIDDW